MIWFSCFSGVIYDGHSIYDLRPPRENETEYLLVGDPVRSRRKRSNQPKIRAPYLANSRSRFVELLLVVDHGVFQKFDEDKEKVFRQCKQIANIVNAVSSKRFVFSIRSFVYCKCQLYCPKNQRAKHDWERKRQFFQGGRDNENFNCFNCSCTPL